MHKLSIILLLSVPLLVWTQEPIATPVEDDMGIVEDRFQDLFFEALKQKGIENHEKAIEALQQCLQMNPNLPEVYFELGKNYKALQLYLEAEQALKKALQLKPGDEWILDELYDVYFQQGATEKAMEIVKQLVDIHPDYKQDLATLYLKQQKFQQALKLLDELDKEFGPTVLRDAMRNDIYNATGNDGGRIENLRQRIIENPKNEENYLNLIYRYSELGMENEAYETAQKLIEEIPDSELAHLALYKYALRQGKSDEAVNSMKIVLNSAKVDAGTKTLILNDFVKLAQINPEYQDDLLELTSKIASENESNFELGYFYLQNGEKKKALENLSLALEEDSTNYDLIRDVLLLKIEFEQYTEVAEQSKAALELYPAQPLLYLINGVSNNRLFNTEIAIESLEMGLDFLVDDIEMEIDFYKELSFAYKQLNNNSKSETFAKKAEALKQQQK